MEKPLTASTAYVTWQDGKDGKVWKILSVEGETLDKFPKAFTEKQMMQILRFARRFELEAFNTGIKYGKEQYKNVYEPKVKQLLEQVRALEEMNISLSTKLEKFIIGE